MQTHPNFLSMSDEEISNMTAPPPGVAEPIGETLTDEQIAAKAAEEEAEATQKAQDDAAALEATKAAEDAAAQEKAAQEAAEAAETQDDPLLAAADDKVIQKPEVVPPKKADEQSPKTDEQKAAEAAAAQKLADEAAAKKAAEGEVAPALTVEQKAAALDSLMTFKANGREVKLNSPEELLRLAQMGANYTKKMQQLQPAMRLLKMLDNNGLKDPNQLSYLIDLHQKKPEAIQKLLADSKFDPMTVDSQKAAEYKPGAHQVSDIEVEFQHVLEEVEASDTGPELLTEVTRQWDEESRRALFQQPRLLAELNSQKSLGFYGTISSEIERRKMLGDLKGVPFLVAYEAVGKELHAQGKLAPPAQTATPPAAQVVEPQKPEPVATRVVVPPAKVANDDKARSASVPKTTATTVPTTPNFLEMPDGEFLKQFEGRV